MNGIDLLAVHWAQEKHDRARDLRRALEDIEGAVARADYAVRAAALSDTGADAADFGKDARTDALALLDGMATRLQAVRDIAATREAAAETAWKQATASAPELLPDVWEPLADGACGDGIDENGEGIACGRSAGHSGRHERQALTGGTAHWPNPASPEPDLCEAS